MRLHALLRESRIPFDPAGVADVDVGGVSDDSRRVHAGDVFVARPGTQADGGAFARDAAAAGATAVISQTVIDQLSVPLVLVPDAAVATSHLAHAFARHPSKVVRTLAVTGTNGKTTTAYLVRHILNHAKQKCGMVGTVAIDDGAGEAEAQMTTPGGVDVAQLLSRMRDNGCRGCAIEASSHALDQSRLAGVTFAGAAFTNLTLDHLDYHKTMADYAAAKAKLFAQLPADAVAAVNVDDAHHAAMTERCQSRVVTFGMNPAADYRAADIAATAAGTSFVLHTPDGQTEIHLLLIGRHNVENALAAITLCCEAMGVSIHQAAAALRTAEGAPGRLQAVRAGQPFTVLIDYAHTDDALHNVLTALRPLTRGALRLVFGCGGDRDRTKRPRMARVAQQHADAIYLTSDNPRTENAQSIINEVMAGFTIENTRPIFMLPDRRTAIERAIADAGPGDCVLIAGKGHENYQIVGATKHPFDDAEEARTALAAAATP